MNAIDAEKVPDEWLSVLPELADIAAGIREQLQHERDIRPPRGLWFEALRRVSPQQVAVVLLGQDPYHGEDKGVLQAHGLAFSVPQGVRPPPSLRNILKELASDTGEHAITGDPITGDLSAWSQQGVLLLNASLTTKGGVAGAHRHCWQPFTQALLRYLGRQAQPLVFILWGADAQKQKASIAPHHVVIESVHPSPLSSHRGFFGSKPFSKCNMALQKFGRPPVDW